MIACISPGSSSADHSLNTLRYAERLKDQTEMSKKYNEINEINRKNYESETKPEPKSLQPKKQVHKIESTGNIKKEESGRNHQNQNQKQILEPKNSHNKMAPKVINSASNRR